jgi:hypothetical protein
MGRGHHWKQGGTPPHIKYRAKEVQIQAEAERTHETTKLEGHGVRLKEPDVKKRRFHA